MSTIVSHLLQPKGGAATGNEISGSSLKRKVEAMAHSNAQQHLTEVDVGRIYVFRYNSSQEYVYI